MANWTKKNLSKVHAMGLRVSANGDVDMQSAGVRIEDQAQGIDVLNRRIFIPGEVISSKNHRAVKMVKKKLKSGETKVVPVPFNTQAVQKYKHDTEWWYKLFGKYFREWSTGKESPLVVEFQFVRGFHSRWDFANMVQLPCDMMVLFEWISDDDITNLLPLPNVKEPYLINPKRPGVWIKIL